MFEEKIKNKKELLNNSKVERVDILKVDVCI